MKIYIEHEDRYLNANERICPECCGSGKERQGTISKISIFKEQHRPESFDLDCCRVCGGKGYVEIVPIGGKL